MRKDYVQIFKNSLSLIVLQGSNYLVPLIVLPYLVIKLGVETFGIYAFIVAFISIVRAYASYGFDITATREIAKNRGDSFEVNKVATNVLLAKVMLLISAFLFVFVLINIAPGFDGENYLYYLAFLIIVGDFLFPIWFFHGIEKMVVVTYLKMGYKIAFSVLIFLTVENESDLWLVFLWDGLGAVLSSIIALFIGANYYGLRVGDLSFQGANEQLRKGFNVFLSSMSVIMYSTINIVILGLLLTPTAVGYYSIAEKIYSAMRGLFNPIVQAVFPYLSRIHEQRYTYISFVRKFSFILFIFLCLASSLTYYNSERLLSFLNDSPSESSILMMKIFSISLMFSIGGLYSNMLVIKGRSDILLNITLLSMFINLVLIYPSIYYYNEIGAAYVFLLVQLVQAIMQFYSNKEIFYARTK